MMRLFNSFLGLVFFSIALPGEAQKVECRELGIYFMLPAGFRSLDPAQVGKLEKRGEKAVKEEYNTETIKGWQPACVQLQDSFKRTITVSSITVKEAIEMDSSVDKFIKTVFAQSDDFLAKRLNSRLGWEINKAEAVSQSDITIGGLPVKKNSFIYRSGGTMRFFSQSYFFNKGGKLYLLNFMGSPKATDNEEVMKAIEAANPLAK